MSKLVDVLILNNYNIQTNKAKYKKKIHNLGFINNIVKIKKGYARYLYKKGCCLNIGKKSSIQSQINDKIVYYSNKIRTLKEISFKVEPIKLTSSTTINNKVIVNKIKEILNLNNNEIDKNDIYINNIYVKAPIILNYDNYNIQIYIFEKLIHEILLKVEEKR